MGGSGHVEGNVGSRLRWSGEARGDLVECDADDESGGLLEIG